jgi:hypothetical protein
LLSHGLTPKVQNAAVYPANGGRLRNKIRINILKEVEIFAIRTLPTKRGPTGPCKLSLGLV